MGNLRAPSVAAPGSRKHAKRRKYRKEQELRIKVDRKQCQEWVDGDSAVKLLYLPFSVTMVVL
jgi:hypothetical protein